MKNRKLVIHSLGESFRDCTRIEEEALTDPGEGEIVIENRYAGVNGVYDQMMCANAIPHTPVVPPTGAGVEAVGHVRAIGASVTACKVGDPVATVGAGGGYREYTICSQEAAIPVPAATPEVLALVPSGVSAHVALHHVGEMRSGETICVTAAAGGLGNVAVQLAINAGNTVIAVCGSDAKARWLTDIGAHRVVQYRREPLKAVLAAEYPERLDLAMDSVGGDVFDALLDNLAPHGRLVVCGATTDRLPPLKVHQERAYTRLYWKAASIRGFMNYRFPTQADAARRRLFAMLAAGEIVPLVDPTGFKGLDAAADAVEHLLSGNNVGKVVLDLQNSD